MSSVARHYSVSGLLSTILEALRAEGKDPRHLTADDLAPVDEFHIRGREATLELVALAAPRPAHHVLDAGSGLGGTARFLASKYGCRVTGIDVTPEFCDAASALSRMVSLESLTEFRCASALDLPFAEASFDLALTQHVQMNIEDKPAFYREIARVLKPGARFAFHDILAGPAGPPHYPVHWAEQPEMSFLIDPDALRELLVRAGFRVLAWRDTTEVSREWYLERMEQRRAAGAPPLGIHLLMGETAPAKFANIGRNLVENRLTVYMGLLEKL